ncbi:MAG TPA: MFS transporter, partial [Anaerolineae bacterium]|nr:MFS transporter [Anaerolineae bacterium]
MAIAAPAFLIAGAAATDEAATAIAKNTASDVFALTVSIALLVSAIIAPIIGTYADITGRRKRLLIIATGIGGLFSSMMFTLQTGSVVLGLGLYFITQIALNVALGSNSSLLPHVARQDDMDRVSSLGYAMGYFGGGVLLLVNTALYLFSDKIGLDSGTAVRIAFLSVGIWWIIFMLPTARTVPEPPATPLAGGSGKPWRDSFTRLKHTFQSARHYEELFKMLIAFWLYSEGIGAIILLATAYGAALGLSTSVLIGTLLMTQFVAFPYALIYGRIPNPKSEWRSAFVFMLLWTGVTMPVLGLYANQQGNEAVGIGMAFILIAADQILGALLAITIGRRHFQ